jgi:manganese efflux pump family protein
MHDLVVRGVIFLSLGVDTLAVAIGLGLSGLSRRRRLQVGLSFAAAEGIMPLAGFVAGKSIAQAVGDAAPYIAIVVLLLLGAYTIRDGMQEQEREYRFHSPMQLLVLCLSVSLDELAIGFSLGLFNVPILAAAAYLRDRHSCLPWSARRSAGSSPEPRGNARSCSPDWCSPPWRSSY